MNGKRIIQLSLALGIEAIVWVALVECYRVFVGGPGTSSFREALGLLVSARIAFWIADSCRRYLIWRVLLRKQRVQQMVDLLTEAKFPSVTKPDTFSNYMFGIEEDERAPVEQRMLARDFRVIEEVIADIDWIAGAQIFWERIYTMEKLLKAGSIQRS